MKKIPLFLILFAIAGIIIISFISLYNGLVTKNESVTKAWQDVESDYQRRMDLIPNLVNTVKGYADFEKSTLQAVVEARSNASKVTFKADELTSENIKKYQDAQNELS